MRIRLLGRLELAGDGGAVAVPGAVPRAILGCLLLADGDVVQRDALIDVVWGEREAKDPVNALQVQITKIRAALAAVGEDGRLLFRHGGYRIVLGPGDDIDVPLYEADVQEGRKRLAEGAYRQAEERLRRGLSRWHGQALEDLPGRFFDGERARLEDLRQSALEDAAFAAVELGRADEVIAELKALVATVPLRERSRARLMLALHRGGRPAEALEVYETGRRLLRSELGADPSSELRQLHAAILRDEDPVRGLLAVSSEARPEPSRRPAASRAASTEGNLVRPLGKFIGRRDAVDAVRAMVARERLVTVLGPGGVGKTRLALEVCALSVRSYDAVWWVDLAPVDVAAVPAAIAGTLGLSDTSVRPDQRPHDYVHRLTSFLAGRRTLLVLDNCEHLLDAVAPVVATLLSACPALTVITTSRAPLEISTEALYPLSPMTDDEAARLFVARAVMADPAFAVAATQESAMRDVRSLCGRLDGLPLAVELAAAHVRLLSVREIEARLDNRFALLAKGDRTAPPRHRTLRAVLDWSYDLLDESAQQVLTQLALYAGGCSIETAEEIAPFPPTDDSESLTVLARLVDSSLLVPTTTPFGSRLRMLETVREYALIRLRESGFAQDAEERFMGWAADFAREAAEGVASGDQQWWARRLTEEGANLRAASELMAAGARPSRSLLLEARLGYYWFISGREEEGIEPLRRSLRAYDAAAEDTGTRPIGDDEEWALFYTIAWLVWLNYMSGRYAEAGALAERHREVWRRARNPVLAVLGRCYDPLHAMLNGREDLEQLFVTADAAVTGTDLYWERVVLQTKWSMYCLRHGDAEGARGHALTAVEVATAADDAFARAWSLTLCGDAEESDGRRESARRRWTEAAAVFGSVGARIRWAYAVLRVGFLDLAEGDHAAVERRLTDVHRLADEIGAEDLHAAVGNLRGVLMLQGGRLSEAAAAFRRTWANSTAPLDRRAVAGAGLAAVRHAAGEPGHGDDARPHIDLVREMQSRLLEPQARRAVGVLLDSLEAHRHTPPTHTDALRTHDWPLGGPSVLAAFC
ncbi:AfsR/SARP family transcriptional regulator [Streptomyces sp. uw30]|uniref:AfsR/SARP family transcriptional regulator n=1 Tax=Streptomyces sp. uw30 TaxID=1828179 RepID=UPI0011CEC0A0|nr:BTAD domain-containing putative transcriptional regulator [Streptomyces sp. uw30]TXS52578.1 AfsR/SARP family transcriptional regulator [Streptomyces sp. uw30]